MSILRLKAILATTELTSHKLQRSFKPVVKHNNLSKQLKALLLVNRSKRINGDGLSEKGLPLILILTEFICNCQRCN